MNNQTKILKNVRRKKLKFFVAFPFGYSQGVHLRKNVPKEKKFHFWLKQETRNAAHFNNRD